MQSVRAAPVVLSTHKPEALHLGASPGIREFTAVGHETSAEWRAYAPSSIGTLGGRKPMPMRGRCGSECSRRPGGGVD